MDIEAQNMDLEHSKISFEVPNLTFECCFKINMIFENILEYSRIIPAQFPYGPVPKTLRQFVSTRCYQVSIRSVYVRYMFLVVFDQILVKVIRSYTFCAILPLKLKLVILFYTFCIRLVYVPQCFCKVLLKSYTFLYVLCNPSAKM